MEKDEIIQLIEKSYSNYIGYINLQLSELWTYGPPGKWTTGQHTLHLLQSIKPLNFALSLPKFILIMQYGVADRPIRDRDGIITSYHDSLKQNKGKTLRKSRHMEVPLLSEKEYLLNRIQVEQKKLQHKIKRLDDQKLNTLVLPHPLMGKMPVRELLIWSAHHVDHHLGTLKTHYQKEPSESKT